MGFIGFDPDYWGTPPTKLPSSLRPPMKGNGTFFTTIGLTVVY